MRDLPIGHTQGDTLFHRLDPRTKLAMVLAVTTCSVVLKTMAGVVALATLILACHIAARTFARIKYFAAYFLALWLVLVVVYVTVKGDLRSITSIQWTTGVFQLFCVMGVGLLLAFTTAPTPLIHSLEKLGLPQGLAFAFSVLLRQVHVFADDMHQIADAMRLRGLSKRHVLTSPSTVGRAVLVPLAVRAIRSADELAAAAETRGVGGDKSKTHLHEASFGKADLVVVLAMLCVLAGLLAVDPSLPGMR